MALTDKFTHTVTLHEDGRMEVFYTTAAATGVSGLTAANISNTTVFIGGTSYICD